MSPWVLRLIIANVAVFFLQTTKNHGFDPWFLFTPRLVLSQPWTAVTYMFLHQGIMHILLNMWGLYVFGTRVESRLGERRFLTLYFLSGIAGAVLSFAFAPRASILGASGAVFGVMLAYATFWPREQILIWGVLPVEVRVMVFGLTALALFNGNGGSRDGVAHFAHLGGFAGAWLYLRWLESHSGAKKFRAKTVAPISDRSLSNWKQVNPASVHEINREELNRILDKVQKSGLPSLSAQERAFLMNFVPMDDRRPPVS